MRGPGMHSSVGAGTHIMLGTWVHPSPVASSVGSEGSTPSLPTRVLCLHPSAELLL